MGNYQQNNYKQYDIYKPNSFNTGCAFSFKIIETDKEGNKVRPSFWIQAIKQARWDTQKKLGSFKENAKNPEKNIFFKLNENEIGGLLNAIERRVLFSAFHSFGEDKTQISFKPYEKKNGDKAFSFSVTKNSALKFGIGVEFSEARTLKAFLDLFLMKFFNQ